MRLCAEPLTSAVAQGLIARLNQELSAQYPEPGATHFRLEDDGLAVFLVAYRDDNEAVGCGALRWLDACTGELKRMYVAADTRGQGVGRALLGALEEHARSVGMRRVVLETGVRQTAALGLYERAGYARIPCFGEYAESPLSLCLGKSL